MAQVIWTDPALSDLNGIAEYIALDKPRAAENLVASVFASVDQLTQFPESGRRPPEIQRGRYRELIVGPCRIFYRVEDETVFVLYVMRGERLLQQSIVEGRDTIL